MNKIRYIIIDSKDNCGTALEKIPKDAKVDLINRTVNINNIIPLGHKFALRNIKKGDYIMKYGEVIGVSTEDINEGDWIHTHNIISSYLKVKNDG
ncbi:MAG: UxaA family hydrolase [Promethearchaeota archaeon]|jgi:altronate dehydratase